MAAPPLEQFTALARTFANTFSIVLPERRPDDAVTLAHKRAAEWVHKVAAWLWRGSDLAIVSKRTPFTAATTQDLWQYYESLPLEQRGELLVLFFIAVELMQWSGVLTREQFPKLRRIVDVYAGAMGLSCFMPRRVYYHLHRAIWTVESAVVRREVHEPQAPLPLSPETEAAVAQAMDSALGLLRGVPPGSATPAASDSRGIRAPWVALLVVASAGVGAMLWWHHSDNVQWASQAFVDRWRRCERTGGGELGPAQS
uniref:Uncharacterized protein n=1 Tax=Pyrodinium bahamense TaxID=73915 RepID=A0A7S0FET9_9DINO|mmetsp:Transcript_26489/g.72740  ORF Transcript_26489/g.72740 Transcript_26489/m.72740 type:complete len:256 (+) Transcript_26489:93-860(+)